MTTFQRQAPFVKKTTDLPDIPSPTYTAAQIKEYIQNPSDELMTTVNNVVDGLNGTGWVDNTRLANGSVTTSKLDPNILNQPTTTTEVQAKLQQHDEELADIAINVKNYGAVGDGVSDDTAAIQSALDHANSLSTGMKLVYLSGVHSINSNLNMYSNIVLCGDGVTSTLQFETPSYSLQVNNCSNVILRDFKITKFAYGAIQLKGNSQNVTIQNINFSSTYQDFMLGDCIQLFACSDVMIDGCTFNKTGYQVIQMAGYVSNNIIVQNCKAYQCYSDFVELNCENTAISRNWIIRNNRVYNSGMYQKTSETTTFGYKVYHWTNNQITSVATEGRFVGITWCDNVLIEGNIVENVGGDSAIHIEEPVNVTIKNNTIKNAHSQSGRFVWALTNGTPLTDNTLQGYNVPKGEQKLTIKDNTFILDNGLNLTNDTASYLLIIGENPSNVQTALTDFGYNNSFVIEGNKFFNYAPMPTASPYTTGYPRVPTSNQYGTGIQSQYVFSNLYIEKNTFQGLNYGLVLYASTSGTNRFGSYVNKNKFNSCATAIVNSGGIIWALQENSFSNCNNAISNSNSVNGFTRKIEGNHFYNSPVTGLNILQSSQRKNKYLNSSNDDYSDPKIYTSATTSVNLATLPKGMEFRGTLIVSAKSNVTTSDMYNTAIYNISYYYLNSGIGYYIGKLALINQTNGSTKVSALSATLDTTNGLLTISVTSSEDYQLSCAVIGY